MELAKILEDGTIDLRFCDKRLGAKMAEFRNNGFLDFVSGEQPQCNAGFIAIDSYEVVDGKVVQTWTIETEQQKIE